MALLGRKLRLYPNKQQRQTLNQMFGNSRYIWNNMLAMLNERYENTKDDIKAFTGDKKDMPKHLWQPSAYELNYVLTQFKREDGHEFLGVSDSTALQVEVEYLKKAFDNFFKNPAHFDLPNFKSRHDSKQSYTGRNQAKVVSVLKKYYMKLPKLGVVKTSKTGQIPDGEIKRFTISCDHLGRYWLALQIDVSTETIPRFKPTGKAIGIDCGLTHMVVLSNGDKVEKLDTASIENQARLWQRKYSKRYHRAKCQLKLEKSMGVENPRQMKDFKNVERARLTKARRQDKIKNIRNNFLHQLTTYLVSEYDVIVIEDLNVGGMLKNHKLAFAIAHASWSTFRDMLEYKCKRYGKTLIVVPPHYTSRTCSTCGVDSGEKPLDIREWTCQQCHTHHDRDINAAINILTKGLASIQATA